VSVADPERLASRQARREETGRPRDPSHGRLAVQGQAFGSLNTCLNGEVRVEPAT
jgi:hypothetical protein